jgi:hypothetical protein
MGLVTFAPTRLRRQVAVWAPTGPHGMVNPLAPRVCVATGGRRAHNPEVAGSNPAPATQKGPGNGAFLLESIIFGLCICCRRSGVGDVRETDARAPRGQNRSEVRGPDVGRLRLCGPPEHVGASDGSRSGRVGVNGVLPSPSSAERAGRRALCGSGHRASRRRSRGGVPRSCGRGRLPGRSRGCWHRTRRVARSRARGR